MTGQTHPISTLVPLAVSVVAEACTILIHVLWVRATVYFVRREKSLGHLSKPWLDLRIFVRVVFYASLAHLAAMAFWGSFVHGLRRVYGLRTAFYHSAVNYTSLGYGDVIMSPSWRLLGPLETANGMLLFGVSTAMIFGVMLWLIQARFVDLKD